MQKYERVDLATNFHPRMSSAYSIPRVAIAPFMALADFSVIVFCAILSKLAYEGTSSVTDDDLGVGILAGIMFVLFARSWGLYRLHRVTSRRPEFLPIAAAVASGLLSVIIVFFFLKTGSMHSRFAFGLMLVLALVGIVVERLALGFLVRSACDSGVIAGKPVVTLGEKGEFSGIRDEDLSYFGVDEVARFELSCEGGRLTEIDRREVEMAVKVARANQASEIALFISWLSEDALRDVMNVLQNSPLPVRLYPDQRTRDILHKHRGNRLDPHLSIEVQRAPLRRWELVVKRAFDLTFALAGLAALLPVLAILAAIIKLDSPGPVIFRQRRIGFDNRVFTIYKFRTMSVLEDGKNIQQARRNDSRVTRVGAILRRTSVDELPQLWNVIRGDMSLVGPRPHALAHDAEYSVRISDYARRHHVKPGLTGAAQVRGFRGETRVLTQMEDRVEADIWYISNWSLLLDFKIVAQTFVALRRVESF